MNRDTRKIGEIYHLGKPARYAKKSMSKIIHFLGDGDDWFAFKYAGYLPKRRSWMGYVIDHIDVFKHHLTLLPYVGEDIENVIKQDPHWRLCIQCGLRYEIVDPDPTIFEKDFRCDYVKLIILSCDDWGKLCTDISRILT